MLNFFIGRYNIFFNSSSSQHRLETTKRYGASLHCVAWHGVTLASPCRLLRRTKLAGPGEIKAIEHAKVSACVPRCPIRIAHQHAGGIVCELANHLFHPVNAVLVADIPRPVPVAGVTGGEATTPNHLPFHESVCDLVAVDALHPVVGGMIVVLVVAQ